MPHTRNQRKRNHRHNRHGNRPNQSSVSQEPPLWEQHQVGQPSYTHSQGASYQQLASPSHQPYSQQSMVQYHYAGSYQDTNSDVQHASYGQQGPYQHHGYGSHQQYPDQQPGSDTQVTGHQQRSAERTISTTPTQALAANPDPADLTPCYVVRPTNDGRGNGLFATRDIASGEAFLMESPLVRFTPSEFKAAGDQALEVGRQVLALPDDDSRAAFMRFRSPWDSVDMFGGQFHEIVRTHGLPFGTAPKIQRGVFRWASYMNHSCTPNAMSVWSAASGRLTVRAKRDIGEGEEIVVSYVDGKLPVEERALELEEKFGFVCVCGECRHKKGSSRNEAVSAAGAVGWS